MSHTLEQQRQLELRLCPQCKMKIANPFASRCPRCFAVVPTQELGCGSCVHRLSCPVVPSSLPKPVETS